MTSSTESIGLQGHIHIEHRDKDGELVEEQDIENLVVNDGLAEMAALLLTDTSGTAFDYIAIGNGTTSPSASDSSLSGTEIKRNAGTGTQQTTNVTDDTSQLKVTFSFSSSKTVEETGIFNASSGGTMLARQLIGTFNVSNGDSLEVTWQITFS